MINKTLLIHFKWSFGITLGSLCVPLTAKLFSNQFNWNTFDFLVFAVIIFSLIFLIRIIKSTFHSKKTQHILIVLLILFFITLFIELAVGIFNTPLAGH